MDPYVRYSRPISTGRSTIALGFAEDQDKPMSTGIPIPPSSTTTATATDHHHFHHSHLPLPTTIKSSDPLSPATLSLPFLLKHCSSLSFGTQLHALSFKLRLSADPYIQTSLLSMYSSHSHLNNALKVFDHMPHKTVVSWTATVTALLNSNRTEDALFMFLKMVESGLVPDRFAIVGFLSSCGKMGLLGYGRSAHCCFEKMRIGFNADDVVVWTALVDMYCKCGDIKDAIKVFDELPRTMLRSVQLWNAMLHGLAVHGRGNDVIMLFQRMEEEEDSHVSPNEVTFVAVLHGCAHSGLLKEGRYYFKLMKTKYMIKPTEKHYGCMVDLLGRAGLLDEAFKLASNMSVSANHVVWGSLLSMCRIHDNIAMAEKVMDRIMRLHEWPARDMSHYVIMSNIYKQAGLVEKQAKLRMMIGRKPKARSWIEAGNAVHTM